MLYTIRLIDEDVKRLSALIELGLQTSGNCGIPLGDETKLALDRFAAQIGHNPQWHEANDPQLRPRGE